MKSHLNHAPTGPGVPFPERLLLIYSLLMIILKPLRYLFLFFLFVFIVFLGWGWGGMSDKN